MTLDEVCKLITNCAEQMNSRYGFVVFDEWAVISLLDNKARVLAYTGPRNDDFLKNFARDLGALRAGLSNGEYGPGDFEFNRHGAGTGYEAFLVAGQGFYVICNNTSETMESIATNPKWLAAQVHFVEFAEKVRQNPLTVSFETRFLARN